MDYVIDQMNPGDWEQVRSIFREGIATGYTTYETDAPSWEKWDAGHLEIARLVARNGDKVLGWAALSPVSNRDAYRGVAELTTIDCAWTANDSPLDQAALVLPIIGSIFVGIVIGSLMDARQAPIH